MCGIAGAFGKQVLQELKTMLFKLSHRGPDGQGVENFTSASLGHTRLAILDVDGGHQPMGYQETWIAFNGEIYNYRELAKEHLTGVALQTHSDTEVLIHLYRKFGPEFVRLLDGMFAFAIQQGDEFFLARDPLGIKPLYLSGQSEPLYFASEIKALAQVTDQIREFPAGHWYHSKDGWYCYYDLHLPLPSFGGDQAQAQTAIRDVLAYAVQKRLLADVPVGISLSGGLDSSIIAYLANERTPHLNSFAVGVEGSEDLEAARKMAALLGNKHHERVYTDGEMLEALPKVIYHLESFDPALVRSAIPNFFLAEMASQYVKVILTGEGADELYAGYDYLSHYDTPEHLQQEMLGITLGLHNTNLQRADRIPMAFGLEARVPFLDVRSVELALSLPPAWKLHKNNIPKAILRQAFANILPPEIVKRPKQKFSQGAGSSDIIAQIAEKSISDQLLHSERARLLYQWNYRLPNKEALYYYRILREFYEDQWIFPTMGRSRSL